MDSEFLQALVFDVLSKHTDKPLNSLTLNTRLAEDLSLDSISILEIVLELEQRSGLPFRSENLTSMTLATPSSLLAHLLELREH